MSNRARVKVTLHMAGETSYAHFRAYGFSPERFCEYRAAMDGVKYERHLNMRLTPIDKVPAILVRLRKARFHVDAAPDLRRALQKRDARDWLDSEALKERIEHVDDELYKQSGDRMHPHQRTGAYWLARMTGALLADDLGTGKSLTTLVALPANAAVLIVAPAVAKGHWRAQIQSWRPQMKCEVLSGRRLFPANPTGFRWPKPGEILITNYDILPNIHDVDGVTGRVCNGKLLAKPCPGCDERIAFSGSIVTTIRTGHRESCSGFLTAPDCPGCHPLLALAPPGMVLVGDEVQAIKNRHSLRGQRFNALAEVVRQGGGRTWLLTGTPLENEPPELWNILKAGGIAEAAFGSWDQFKTSFHGKKVQYGHEWGLPGDDVPKRLQRVMLRRMKKDVLPDLPRKRWGNHEVELDPKALRSIEEFLRASKKSVAEIVALVEMKEVGFEFMSSVRAALASAKIPAMLEIVKDFEEKNVPLIVFSAHRAPIDILAQRPGWIVITGSENADQKTRANDQFQHGYYADAKLLRSASVISLAERRRDVTALAKREPPGILVKGVLRRVNARGEVIYPKGIALTIDAGGVSISLTRACYELFVDRAWKPTANLQAEDRPDRIGQTNSVVVTTLVGNHPLDARVTEVLVRKTRLISLSIDAAADGTDAPLLTVKELEKYRREEQEAIACGHAVRRIAEGDEEKRALQDLHTLTFRSRSDERLAGELAEEALAIGLSDAQWQLVIRMTERAQQELQMEEEKKTALEFEEKKGMVLEAALEFGTPWGSVTEEPMTPEPEVPLQRARVVRSSRWSTRRGGRRL